MTETQSWKKYVAEMLGTFTLVFLGCAAILSGAGYVGIALAFGLALTIGIVAFGPLSGGHFNPAVTIAMWLNKKTSTQDVVPYVVCQIIGATIAAGVLYAMWAVGGTASTTAMTAIGGTATNWTGITATGALLGEIFLTALFVVAIFAAVSRPNLQAYAPLVIGLALAGIHFAAMGLTGASVNPARSLGPALFNANNVLTAEFAMAYVVGPVVGGLLGAFVWRFASEEQPTAWVAPKRAMEVRA
ncbi:MAG TPA: aquaporin [Candidatus Thermoplasmatota archaeon]|nr:aquaporin [Candidatus Thermoplasmatota archaeon]